MIASRDLLQLHQSWHQNIPALHSFAPGRINLLGEHVDYLGGHVLPAAIDKGISITFSPGGDRLSVVAADLNKKTEWTESQIRSGPAPASWQAYVWGALHESLAHGASFVPGQWTISSDLPTGAGLSSSAALEVAVIQLVMNLSGTHLSSKDMALMAQKVENLHVGTQCGIMDQFASIHGQEDSFMELDCSSLNYKLYKADHPGACWILINSMISHELGDNYNRIRHDLEVAEKTINGGPLIQCSLEQVTAASQQMSAAQTERATYAISEVCRIKEFIEALKTQNLEKAGKLLCSTHWGLSKQLKVSTPELDHLVRSSEDHPAWLGGRMMGGGFGGCTINLVTEDKLEDYLHHIRGKFAERFDIQPDVYPVKLSRGAHLRRLD